MLLPQLKSAYSWYLGKSVDQKTAERMSRTRDHFQARLDSLLSDSLKNGFSEMEAYLLVAIVGEIGNNAFDHNLGQWKNDVGCWFDYGFMESTLQMVIADRGQGVLSSLKRVLPAISSDQQALEIAFERVVSGRAPEKRGNGLKFVRSVINGSATRGMVCQSATGSVYFGKMDPLLEAFKRIMEMENVPGVFSVIFWKKP